MRQPRSAQMNVVRIASHIFMATIVITLRTAVDPVKQSFAFVVLHPRSKMKKRGEEGATAFAATGRTFALIYPHPPTSKSTSCWNRTPTTVAAAARSVTRSYFLSHFLPQSVYELNLLNPFPFDFKQCRKGLPCGTCSGNCMVCLGHLRPGPLELGSVWEVRPDDWTEEEEIIEEEEEEEEEGVLASAVRFNRRDDVTALLAGVNPPRVLA